MKVEEDLDKDTNYKLIIEELNKSYNSYIQNKEAVIELGALGINVATVGVVTLFGWIAVPLAIGSILLVGRTKEAYKKELLQTLSVGELGNVAEIEKYYKQLPKDVREKWAKDNAFSKLADHLKIEIPENRIYNIDEVPNFNYQVLDDPEDPWVVLSGNDEITII
ncbi:MULTISPECIES: hypothetical protein [unclassified Rickettsia]|uniref:hypothetical protein n=1 Tax=unclassified Rickettsia TaxID=114295 RepID=UPI003132A53F